MSIDTDLFPSSYPGLDQQFCSALPWKCVGVRNQEERNIGEGGETKVEIQRRTRDQFATLMLNKAAGKGFTSAGAVYDPANQDSTARKAFSRIEDVGRRSLAYELPLSAEEKGNGLWPNTLLRNSDATTPPDIPTPSSENEHAMRQDDGRAGIADAQWDQITIEMRTGGNERENQDEV